MSDIAKEFYEDDILNEVYYGIVKDNKDPKNLFRCKVAVIGKFAHGDESGVPVEDLPWVTPSNTNMFDKNGAGATLSVPKIGSKVRITFDGDIYSPKYESVEDVSDPVVDLVKGSYENAAVFAHDEVEQLKFYYTKEAGLIIFLKDSIINIKNDGSILIEHAGKSSSIELKGPDIDVVTNNSTTISSPNNIGLNSQQVDINGAFTNLGANPIFSNVNGEPLVALLQAMAVLLDAKLPVTGGVAAALVSSFIPLILSKTVKTTT